MVLAHRNPGGGGPFWKKRVLRLTVDAAHLLCNHDCGSSIVCSSNARNGETIPKSAEVGGVLAQFALLLVDDNRVVKVSCRDDWMRS